MHDWMMSPAGIALAATESIVMIGLSLLANAFNEDDPHHWKRFIARYWPYVRDSLKALKNTYRSIRGVSQVFGLLSGYNLNYMVLPLGITLAALAIVNRALVRYTRAQRSSKVRANNALLKAIHESLSLSAEECAKMRGKIQYESLRMRALSYAAAFYSGFVDGIYLYMGVLSLATLPPPILIMAVTLSVLYSLLCIASRVYEIYAEQNELVILQAKIDLALCGKELQAIMMQLQQASNDESRAGLELALERKLQEFEQKRAHLRAMITPSFFSAALAGLRGGLAAYGALASVIFAIATVTTLMFAPFPPALAIACVIAGLVCLIGFITYSLIKHYSHEREHREQATKPNSKLMQLANELKSNPDQKRDEVEVRNIITEAMYVHAAPNVLYQEGFEVMRSFFSGVGKGQKSVDFTAFPLQEQDDQGHYRDTPIMFGIMAVSATVYTGVLTKRAYQAYDRAAQREKSKSEHIKPMPVAGDKPASSFKHDVGFFRSHSKSSSPIKADVRENEIRAALPCSA